MRVTYNVKHRYGIRLKFGGESDETPVKLSDDAIHHVKEP